MNVLLGIGGSDDGFRALDRALSRVRPEDELTVAILENDTVESDMGTIEREVEATIGEAGIDARIERLEGHAGSQLVSRAEGEEIDLIVLGGGQRSPMGKIQIGEIAEFVLFNAPVSVTLVR